MAFRMYKSFRNMVASAIVGGDMSNMNPRIWERAVFSAKELTPGTFRNSLRTSIRVRLPPTGQFAKGALIKLIMAECKKLGAKYLFISEFTTTNSNKKSTKNGVLPPPHISIFRTHHPSGYRNSTKSRHAKVFWNDHSLYASSSMAKYITLQVTVLRVNLVVSKRGRSLLATSSSGDQEPSAQDFYPPRRSVNIISHIFFLKNMIMH